MDVLVTWICWHCEAIEALLLDIGEVVACTVTPGGDYWQCERCGPAAAYPHANAVLSAVT